MTHFLRDILRQPNELQRTLEHLSADGRGALDAAVAAVRTGRHVYLTGIGSSWHAGLNVAALFQGAGRPVYLVDAAEMGQFAAIPAGAVVFLVFRVGRRGGVLPFVGEAGGERGAGV